jgi:hypothetical protein
MIWHRVTIGPTPHRDQRTWDFQPRSACGPSHRLRRSSFNGVILAALAATSLTACSLHPIPDDVSPIPTDVIVAAARCELRIGLIRMVEVWLEDDKVLHASPNPGIMNEGSAFAKLLAAYKARYPKKWEGYETGWREFLDVAVAYDWTFEITETNSAEADVGFRLPFVNGNLNASAGGSLAGVRLGKRTFKSQDRISSLLTQRWDNICHDRPGARSTGAVPVGPLPRNANLLYPITGSIGLDRVAESFLKVASQEGALDTFTDEITFTTTVSGEAGAGLTLTPVPKEFRLVSANAGLSGSRVDIHKVKVSLAFPKARPLGREGAAKKLDDSIVGGIRLSPAWRASYALCVIDARSREQELKQLRREPPEVTCLESTDAFFQRGAQVATTHDPVTLNEPGDVSPAPLQRQGRPLAPPARISPPPAIAPLRKY